MLITGASAGIGAATAILASEKGWDVGIGYNSDQAGAEETAAVVRSNGQKAVILKADMADPEQIGQMFETFNEVLGPMAAFINNAGIVMPASRFEDISIDRLQTIFAINQTGAFVAAQHAVRAMAFRYGGKGGAIVNISSVASIKGGTNEYVDYAATKGAMDTMTIGLAKEMAQQGVRVNAVRPGTIETGIHAKGGQPNRTERVAPTVPMGRVGTAPEIAQSILFLASEAASYITGTFVDVAGGRQI
jgi:NAD(P)-dependent dehydrogenase (short-subunit alcohol dehydrogenase family)